MKKWLIYISAFLIVGHAKAQSTYTTYKGSSWEQIKGNGKMKALQPAILAFSKLEVRNLNVKVKVITGAKKEAMEVSIDDNLKDFFRIKQEDSVLKLYMDLSGGKYHRWISENHTQVTIYTTSLHTLFNIGNSNLEVQLNNQPAMLIHTEGNPDFVLKGKVEKLQLYNKGNADIDAGSLEADQIMLSTEGNADMILNTRELITITNKGNNDINNNYGQKSTETNREALQKKQSSLPLISFKIRNNTFLPVKINLISYRPDEKGNGTNAFVLMPYGTKKYRFPVGTQIYLANQEQVETVMSGKKLDGQVPFRIVQREDENKVINIK